jgi:hypothetical protein
MDGRLSDKIDVWLTKPEPLFCSDGDLIWIAPLTVVDRGESHWGEVSLAIARGEVGYSIPSTERECLHIGRGARETS